MGVNLGTQILPNLSADPATGVAGQVYWNTTDQKFRKHNGTAWSDLDTTGGSSPLTTKGDLYGFSTVDARLPVGTNDQTVIADSAQALGVKWGTLPVAGGGTGATTLTANNVILGNGTGAVQFVAPGTSGNVLTSNGTTWQSTAPAASGGTPQHILMAVNYMGAASSYDPTFTNTAVGSGGKSTTYTGVTLQTGSTSGSAIEHMLHFAGDTTHDSFDNNDVTSLSLQFGLNGLADGDIWLGIGRLTVAGTELSRGSFYNLLGYMGEARTSVLTSYAVTGTSSAWTRTSFTPSTTNRLRFFAKQNATADAKFYSNGTLVATHSTNLGVSGIYSGSVSNRSTASNIQLILKTSAITVDAY